MGLVERREEEEEKEDLTKKLNTLHKIPTEIRIRIFEESGVTQNTLDAFRGDKDIYQDALKVYWDTTRFTIPWHTIPYSRGRWIYPRWKFSTHTSLSEKSLNSMKKAQVIIK